MKAWRGFFGKLHRRVLEYGLLALFLALRDLALLCGLLYLWLLADWLCHALEEWMAPHPLAAGSACLTPLPALIRAVAFSPAEAYLAFGEGRQVRVLNLRTLSTSTYAEHRDLVSSLAWSPDGTRLASASADGTVQVWSVAPGGLLFTYTRHRCAVRVVAWSPDGTRLATAGVDGSLHIWDVPGGGGSVVAKLPQLGAVTTLSWSPDGSCLLSGGRDGRVILWDPETGAALDRYAAHAREVSTVSWCPDAGRLLFATAGYDGYVKVWSAERQACLFAYLGHTRAGGLPGSAGVVACAWTPDGRRIISADLAETVQEWTPPLAAGQALVVITVPIAAFTLTRNAAEVSALDVRALCWTGDEVVTQMAVAGGDWMYLAPSPADPRAMLEDPCGGRLQPLYTTDVRSRDGGS